MMLGVLMAKKAKPTNITKQKPLQEYYNYGKNLSSDSVANKAKLLFYLIRTGFDKFRRLI